MKFKKYNLILAIGDDNKHIFEKNKKKLKNFILVNNKTSLQSILKKKIIKRIYIIHWGFKIPQYIINKYECISFHMSKLPYGIGGSPLQNLIIRNKKKSHLSIFKTSHKVDEGEIIKQLEFSLAGNADQILNRVTKICINQIVKLDKQTNIVSYKQIGKKTHFKRIKYHENELNFNSKSLIISEKARVEIE